MSHVPDEPLDDLLSADVDGETSPAEHARIESDPELRSRREALKAAATVAALPPTPLAPAVVDRIVEHAMDGSRADGGRAAPVRSASSGSRARARWRQPPVLVAAAVVLLGAIGIGLIVTAPSGRHRTDTSASAAKGLTTDKAAGAEGRGVSPPSTRAGGSGSTDQNAVAFLGRFASVGELRAALQTTLPPVASAPAPEGSQVSSGQADRCATVVEARDPALTRPNRQTTVGASLAGRPLVVLQYRARAVKSGRQTTRVVALGAAACDEILDIER